MCYGNRTHRSRRGFLLSSTLLLAFFATPFLQAQIHGVPASVTSLDNGNHTLANPPGVPASVTSLGPQGYTPFGNGRGCCFNNNRQFFTGGHHRGRANGDRDNRDRDSRDNGFLGGSAVPYPVYVPYYYQTDDGTSADAGGEDSSSAGPTIFDRHSNNSPSLGYPNRLDDRLDKLEQKVDDAQSGRGKTDDNAAATLRPAPDQPPTVLIYRDGHSVEVKNYAIVGDVLYDYSTGSRRKIALADLDLAATQKQNDDRGIDFRVPGHSSGN